jgi:hypothetical protein
VQLMDQIGNRVSDAFLQSTLADQRQRATDSERQRFDSRGEQAQPSELLQDRVLDSNFSYRDARSGISDWCINQDTLDAFSVARKAYGDTTNSSSRHHLRYWWRRKRPNGDSF